MLTIRVPVLLYMDTIILVDVENCVTDRHIYIDLVKVMSSWKGVSMIGRGGVGQF